MSRYYNKESEPITRDEWAALTEIEDDLDYKRVGLAEKDGIKISTVWIGLHFQILDGPPMIFETMIFGGDRDGDQYRYATLSEAENGHVALVLEVFG